MGKCDQNDYEVVESYNVKEGTTVFRCKCGIKYGQKFPYFNEMLPDGSIIPYMKKNRWGIWKSVQ
jgi:hypothetical protein